MNLDRTNEVVKASSAVQIQGKTSHLQRRMWNVLLANAYNELPDQEIHSVKIVELMAKLNFNSRNLKYLNESLKALVDCVVEWNILGKDKEEEWGAASLLASVQIKNGTCIYSFAPPLRQKLYNPRIYTKLNLRLQNQFKSQYALVLWEVCFDYFDTVRDQGETPFIPLDTFKELMGISPSDYTAFKTLNQRVIKPAVKEINGLTNFLVEVEQKRGERKVTELKFRITKVRQISIQESLFPNIDNFPPVAIELVQVQIDQKVALKIADQAWNFVNPQKLSPPGTYPDFAAYVAEKIEMSLHATNVKNRGGFIIDAIRENYQDNGVQRDREMRAEKARKKELEDLSDEFKVKRENILRQAVHAQPELIERAAECIQYPLVRKRLLNHASAMEAYQEGGMVKANIDSILAAEFCKDLLAPVNATYEDEKARILGKNG